MELYLQFGYGMKSLTLQLAQKWGGATVILSPRDISPMQLVNWSKDFEKNNVKTLFDPQLFYPKETSVLNFIWTIVKIVAPLFIGIIMTVMHFRKIDKTELINAFEFLDTGNTGKIKTSELRHSLMVIGDKLTAEDVYYGSYLSFIEMINIQT